MDLGRLDAVVHELFSAGLAASTRNSYRSGSKRYIEFCSSKSLNPFPVAERSLSLFLAYLYTEGLSGNTAKTYLAGIRYTQIAMGLADPRISEMQQLEYIVKGFRKLSGGKARPRLPITPVILEKLRKYWVSSSKLERHDSTMLWAASCMCFFGFLRTGEVVVPSDTGYDPAVHLSYGDVKVDEVRKPSYVEVTIKASKTDPFRKGVKVYLGTTGVALCPVAAILSYMVSRGSRPGPFFAFSDHRPLTRDRLVKEVRQAMQVSGLDDKLYSGHSFRIGAATTAASCGLQDSLIKTLGRWESAAYTIYIRTPRTELCGVAAKLVAAARQY